MENQPPPSAEKCAGCGRECRPGEYLQHRGRPFCMFCVGQSLDGRAAAGEPGDRRPALAVILSLVPGLGQMYNRQLLKGTLVLGAFLFITIVQPFGHSELVPVILVSLYFWNLFDAYWTARRLSGGDQDLPDLHVPDLRMPHEAATPAWGIVLILLGVLFLLNNFGVQWLTFDRIWPAALMGVGLWLLISYAMERRPGGLQ